MAAGNIKIEDPPSSVKTEAWHYFGFHLKRNNKGVRVTGKTKTVFIYYERVLKYKNRTTTNKMQHVSRQAPVSLTYAQHFSEKTSERPNCADKRVCNPTRPTEYKSQRDYEVRCCFHGKRYEAIFCG